MEIRLFCSSETWLCEVCRAHNKQRVKVTPLYPTGNKGGLGPDKSPELDNAETKPLCNPSSERVLRMKSEDSSMTPHGVNIKSERDVSVEATPVTQHATRSGRVLSQSNENPEVYISPLKCASSESKSSLQISPLLANNEERTTVIDKDSGFYNDLHLKKSDLEEISLSSTILIVQSESEAPWEGKFEVFDKGYHIYDGIRACFPNKVSVKAYQASKRMPKKLQFYFKKRLDVWPKIYQVDPPAFDDIALYFLPSGLDRSKEKYVRLLERMNKFDYAMCSCFNGVELLIYTSNLLPENSQRLNSQMYLWGAFRCSKKNHNQHENPTNPAIPDTPGFLEPQNVKYGSATSESIQGGSNFPANDTGGLTSSSSVRGNIMRGSESEKVPTFSIIPDAPPGFSNLLHMKYGGGSSEACQKDSIPPGNGTGGCAFLSPIEGYTTRDSDSEKAHSSSHQVCVAKEGMISSSGKLVVKLEVSECRGVGPPVNEDTTISGGDRLTTAREADIGLLCGGPVNPLHLAKKEYNAEAPNERRVARGSVDHTAAKKQISLGSADRNIRLLSSPKQPPPHPEAAAMLPLFPREEAEDTRPGDAVVVNKGRLAGEERGQQGIIEPNSGIVSRTPIASASRRVSRDLSLVRPQYVQNGKHWVSSLASRERLRRDGRGEEVRPAL